MVPSLLEGLLGLWLVWIAVLDPALEVAHGSAVVVPCLAMIVLGVWTFRIDYLKWPSVTDIVLGATLGTLFIVDRIMGVDALTFWFLVWGGCVAGIVSLWSAFYRQGPEAIISGDTQSNQPTQ